ncbi:MAG TPA: phosphopantetheine-binding protein [Pseudobacteroides sp.]|uniref:acyl carrier protein n=1 Tax=Pseudobacteroides sp. TaxID=1968840 RepID=UPI002F9363B9
MDMNENEIFNKVKEIVVDYLRVNEDEVSPETNLVEELCADSIALVELGFRFSETFSIPMIEGDSELYIMKNLVSHIIGKMQEA